MKIPKKWKGANGLLNHLVAVNLDPSTGQEIVTSKVWATRHKAWRYLAEPRYSVEWTLKFNRKLKKEDS